MAQENVAGAEGAVETSGAQMDKFQGFSTVDGAVQTPPKVQNANAKPMKGKAADAEPEGEGEEGQQPGGEGKPHKSADKRISQAVGRQRAAERRADAAEARATATEARLAAIETRLTGAQTHATAPKAPDPKDFDGGEFDARYIAALARFEAKQEVAAATTTVRAEATATAQTAEQQRAQVAFTAKRDAFFETASEEFDDFEEVVGATDVPISPTVGELALDSEFGAQIMYELASDLKEARKVHAMPAAKQAAWFGRQEAKLSSSHSDADDGGEGDGDDGEPPKRQSGPKSKVTRAPAPGEYEPRGQGTVPKVSAATPDFAQFERMAMGAGKK